MNNVKFSSLSVASYLSGSDYITIVRSGSATQSDTGIAPNNYIVQAQYFTSSWANNARTSSYFNAVGNVGIGTTSPLAKLHVSGSRLDNSARILVTDQSGGIVRLNADGYYNNTDEAAGVFLSGPANQGIKMVSAGVASYITATPTNLGLSYAGGPGLSFLANARLNFWGQYEIVSSGSASYIPLTIITADNQSSNVISIGKVTTPGSYLTINGEGNVGIGTPSPEYALDISKARSGGALGLRIYNTSTSTTDNHAALILNTANGANADTAVVFAGVGEYIWSAGVDNSDSDKFKIGESGTVGTATHLTIASSGNVGIGTTSPGAALEVDGTTSGIDRTSLILRVPAAAQNYAIKNKLAFMSDVNTVSSIDAQFPTGPSGPTGNLIFNVLSQFPAGALTEVMRLQGNGNVGIGTSPSYLLHVNTDSAGKPGASGLWTIVSDERIKTDIVPADLDRCYDIVKQVGLKHFGFKPGVYSDEQINDKHSLGWIAQDVQKVFGKAVSIKPFTLQTDIPDGTEEYEEQEFTVETVNKVETSIQVINGKPVQVSKVVTSENKVMLFDMVDVLDEAGAAVMESYEVTPAIAAIDATEEVEAVESIEAVMGTRPVTYKMPRMITKTRPKVRREVIEDCLDLNGGQMNAALYGAVQCLMAKVEAQAVTIAALQTKVGE